MCSLFVHIWSFVSSDRGLAIIAILVGVGGILRAEWLFERLYKKEKLIRDALLQQANTVLQSYAAFSRALQAVELDPLELRPDGAFALLTSFHFQQLLHKGTFTKEQLHELQRLTRKNIDTSARGYVEMLTSSGLGKIREGVKLEPEEPENSPTSAS